MGGARPANSLCERCIAKVNPAKPEICAWIVPGIGNGVRQRPPRLTGWLPIFAVNAMPPSGRVAPHAIAGPMPGPDKAKGTVGDYTPK